MTEKHKQEAQEIVPSRSKFATFGKFCICGHGVGAHRNSAGAKARHCHRCECPQYERDFSNKEDWSQRESGDTP